MQLLRAITLFITVLLTISVVFTFAPTMLGILGDQAADSAAQDGQGFDLDQTWFDRAGNVVFILVPATLILGFGGFIFIGIVKIFGFVNQI